MYGLINRSLIEMVTSKCSSHELDQILSKANVSDFTFIDTDKYDDKITYDLVGATCEILKLKPGPFLKEFGHHWVLKTAASAYSHLMEAGGKTFEEFLLNLPAFHDRISLLFADLQPPEFESVKTGKSEIKLIYRSARPGLGIFVVGLIEGLAIHYKTKVQCEELTSSPGKTTFRISWS